MTPIQSLIALFFLAAFACPAGATSLREEQESFPRVHAARLKRAESVKRLFARVGLPYPPADIFLRAFKRERVLEVWARAKASEPYVVVKEFPFCAFSGHLGPKRQQDDQQIPEGFYQINAFNPNSQYHLSLRVSYPNAVDQIRGVHGRLGGDIFIHGGCATVGCLPITDPGIEELYLIAVDTLSAGSATIPLHLFPMQLTNRRVNLMSQGLPDSLAQFWRNLKQGYDYFERFHTLPLVTSDGSGIYTFR